MANLVPYLLVALGGALGSTARFGVGVFITPRVSAGLPLATLVINVTGCFLIALFLSAATNHTGLSGNWRYFFPIGFVGGYTTFSTYEWELFKLNESNAWPALLFYFVASNALGFAAILLGNNLGKRI